MKVETTLNEIRAHLFKKQDIHIQHSGCLQTSVWRLDFHFGKRLKGIHVCNYLTYQIRLVGSWIIFQKKNVHYVISLCLKSQYGDEQISPRKDNSCWMGPCNTSCKPLLHVSIKENFNQNMRKYPFADHWPNTLYPIA